MWQKLRMPRSYDYATTVNKRYDERLRMPKFPFSDEQREAVMTFILGLTNEAPDAKYIYKPDRRQQAIVDGRHVLEKYNCAGCHVLDMERWNIAFEPTLFDSPPTTTEFPFVRPPGAPEEIAASLRADRAGMLHAQLHGMPVRDDSTGQPKIVDQDGVAVDPEDKESLPFFQFTLYDEAVVSGYLREVGVQNLLVPANREQTGPARQVALPWARRRPGKISLSARDRGGKEGQSDRGGGRSLGLAAAAAAPRRRRRCKPIGCTIS